MGVRVEKKWIVYESVTMTPIQPGIVLPEDKVEQYLREHPFPETEDYTKEDLLMDTRSDGMWVLGDYVTEEQREYIDEMVQAILEGRCKACIEEIETALYILGEFNEGKRDTIGEAMTILELLLDDLKKLSS